MATHYIHAGWCGLHLQSSGIQIGGALSAKATSFEIATGLGMALTTATTLLVYPTCSSVTILTYS